MTTRNDIKQLLVLFQTAYPNYHPADKTLAINLWHSMLKGFNPADIQAAATAYIATDTSGFAPTVGQLLDKLREMHSPKRLTGMEAWALVLKAIQNSGWETKKQYDLLPPDVQRAVGSARQLHAWATDENFNESVAMSQFLKSYEAAVRQREEQERMPESARALIERTAHRLEGSA